MDASIRRALTGQRVTDVERDTAHAKGIESHLGTAEQAPLTCRKYASSKRT
jgi:hypothetical protein